MALSEQEEEIDNFIDSLAQNGTPSAEPETVEDESAVATDEQSRTTQEPPSDEDSGEGDDAHDYKKRFNDTRTRLNEERERNKALEQRLLSVDTQATAPTGEPDAGIPDDWKREFSEKWEEDPEEATTYVAELIQQRTEAAITRAMSTVQSQVTAVQTENLARQEVELREQHSDYDEVINDFVVPEFKTNGQLAAEWRENGKSAAEAYEIGLKLKEQSEFRDNPDGLRERIREEVLAELKGEKGSSRTRARPRTLSGVNSQGGRRAPTDKTIPTPNQVLQSVIPDWNQ